MNELGDDVVLFAVPAEEYVEMEFRSRLPAEGKLSCLGGKAELIGLDASDDIAMAMMIHHETQVTGNIDDFNLGADGVRTSSHGVVEFPVRV